MASISPRCLERLDASRVQDTESIWSQVPCYENSDIEVGNRLGRLNPGAVAERSRVVLDGLELVREPID